MNKEQAEKSNIQFVHDGIRTRGLNEMFHVIPVAGETGTVDILDVLSDNTKWLTAVRVVGGVKTIYPTKEVTDDVAYSAYNYSDTP